MSEGIGKARSGMVRLTVAGETVSVPSTGQRATNLSDADLVRRIKSGEQKAFGILIERYQGGLLRLVGRFAENREDAEDVVQETFIAAYRQMARFRGEASLATWLSRIAIYRALKASRRHKRSVNANYEHDRANDHQPDAAEFVTVREAVARLPKKLRVPVVLRFWEDLSGREIAEVLDWKQSTVWTRLYRGLDHVRRELQVDEGR